MHGREYLIRPGVCAAHSHRVVRRARQAARLVARRSPTTARNQRPSSASVGSATSGRSSTRFAGPRSGARRKSMARPPSSTCSPATSSASTARLIELEIGRFLARDTPLAKIEIRRAAARRLRLLQQDMLEAMASGVPLKGIMDTLCRRVEAMAPSVICSVLAVDRDLQLRHIASPSIPQHYSTAIDGLLIGPKTGSCGTAAFRGEPVEVTDIATDPLWEDYKHLALPLGLRACWSSPIKGADGRVIGAFAFYYPRPRGPTSLERQVVATCLNLCTIALEHEETRCARLRAGVHRSADASGEPRALSAARQRDDGHRGRDRSAHLRAVHRPRPLPGRQRDAWLCAG